MSTLHNSAFLLVGAVLFLVTACGITAESNEREHSMSDFSKPSEEELQARLTPSQYSVTQNEGTEPAFKNEYWDNHEEGIYVDIVSGEPLFSSHDKFDSGSGWPSFTRPIEAGRIIELEDRKLWMKRIEARSAGADSHLGHIFPDGPAPTGMRYCVNSAALRFVSVDRMQEEGYGEYLKLFEAQGSPGSSKTVASQSVSNNQNLESVILAGGCFWGVEHLMKELDGVVSSEVGYAGGTTNDPTYKQVCSGSTGHAEVVQIVFDPSKVSFEEVLGYFFRLHDPTTRNRQHNDVGTQYRSAIYYSSDEQRQVAEEVVRKLDRSGAFEDAIVTEIAPASEFWSAEEYHQDYLDKNPGGYMCHVLQPE